MQTNPSKKTCKRCGETKPVEAFAIDRSIPSGRKAYCTPCYRIRQRDSMRDWYQQPKNRETVRQKNATVDVRQNRRKYWKTYGHTAERALYHRQLLCRKHGITLDRYAQLLEAQNHRCAICGNSETARRSLAIDHDHRCCRGVYSCGKCIRGLLCFTCNRALGGFREDPRALMNASLYLLKNRAAKLAFTEKTALLLEMLIGLWPQVKGKDVPNVKAAIYARVSTTDQTCDLQLRELREYCQRRGWEISGEYVDTGWSGAKARRPQLDRLMKDASLHKFDVVMVWKLDRFGRSVSNLVEGLQQLAQWGIRFLAVTQSIDTDQTNPTSKLLLWILAAVAEFEREMIRERVKAGMSAAKHRGQRCGRPRKVADKTRARELQVAGQSIRDIAKALGIGRGTAARLLATA